MTAPATKVFLAIGPGCWGRGDTPVDAVKKAASEGGYSRRKDVEYNLHRVDAGTRMVFDSWGSARLQTPEGEPQINTLVATVDGQCRLLTVEV